jgi:hypothetical protein
MNLNFQKLAEFIVGSRDLATMCVRTVFGVVGPATILGYGISCIVSRQATIIGRGALEHIIGLPALVAGVAYSLAGVAAYVFICWDDHPHFSGVRDTLLQLLLIAIAILFAATIAIALL